MGEIAHPRAVHFQVDVRTVENWMSRRMIPYIKIGKIVRFDPETVRAQFRKAMISSLQ